MHVFGVGSFSFMINKTGKEKTINVEEFFNELERLLYKLPTVNDVFIYYSDKHKERFVEYSDDILGMNVDGRINPFINFLDIKFDISLSKRVQGEIYERMGFYLPANATTEKFRVHIKNYYYTAVTFVEIIDADRDTEGSKAVVLVREYLNEQFNKLNGYISFDCQGPSPFHANFYVFDKNDSKCEDVLSTKLIEKRGYNDIEIYIEPSCSVNSAEFNIMDFVMNEMISEIDLYYFIITKNKQANNSWDLIEYQLEELVLLMSGKGNVLNYFKKKKLVDDLLMNLWVFKKDSINRVRAITSQINEEYSNDKIHFIKLYVDKEIESVTEYSIDDTKSLVQFYEGKNSKAFEMMITFLTALVGGVVGAIATVLTQGT
ncbi:Uncharacterised protein [Yersinia rohdei]|uniref:hypothetical protein n=1 Tax=Yersinia rohdei TaxID=29485 RepID=UPI0005DAB6CB|nr:hypothetical protein [Yersinia rohdei]CNJ35903.1 Uncharacterised protein [Yersinia rohdei]